MTRVVPFALLVCGVLSASGAFAARADVEVAPPPREVRPDGSRDPAPQPEPVKKEDPREVVERIIKNSNAVGDKLAKTDTGPETRTTQDKILKDIDALLNPDPPKSDKDKDKDQDKNKDMNPDSKKDMKDMPMGGGGMGDKKMDMPMGGMGDEQPMGGDQPRERRPRQQSGDQKDQQPKDPGKDKQPSGAGGQQANKQPMDTKQDPKKKDGKTPDAKSDGKPPPGGLFPNQEEVVKEAWGHLPDKLRQQATQYYSQEFMPRYAELLKQYYSSLAEKK